MILGGEVDASRSGFRRYCGGWRTDQVTVQSARPESADEPIPWIELKTSATIRGERDVLKYERKLLKFWAQSFLLGVPKIIVGFRDDRGILQDLEELQTQEIPSIIQNRGKRTWDGNLCLNFAATFLDCEYDPGYCRSCERIAD